MGDATERLWGLLEPWLEAEGLELDDLEMRGRGAGRVVRVIVDAEDGVDLDRIAEISRGLSRLLDEDDFIEGSYTLEVSSPGLERALRRPAHYHKVLGSEVVVKTKTPVSGASSHRGILAEANGEGISVKVDGEDRRIPFASVTQARTVFRWEKAPKPGKRGTR